MCRLSYSVVSASLRPYGLWPTRLLCPRNFPGKNTGVGCHFLLQGTFPSWGSNPSLLWLLHWPTDSLSLSHLGSLTTSFSRGQILYHWATWEASQLRLVMVIEDTLKNIYLKNLLRLIHGQIDGIFLSFLFLFLRLNNFHCPIAVLSSAWSNLPLNSFSEIFISVFHFSASEFLLHVPFIDIFIFFTFSAFSFSDLSILKTVLFKSLPGISAIRSFPASFCWFTFFFWMGHTFIFLCMSRDFCCCWELDIWI